MGIASLHPSTASIEKAPDRSQGLSIRGSFQFCLFRLADVHFQRADAVDTAFKLVAGLELGDAGRRSRHDDVAGGKSYLLRKLPDDLGHDPDQLGEITLLGFLAV